MAVDLNRSIQPRPSAYLSRHLGSTIGDCVPELIAAVKMELSNWQKHNPTRTPNELLHSLEAYTDTLHQAKCELEEYLEQTAPQSRD